MRGSLSLLQHEIEKLQDYSTQDLIDHVENFHPDPKSDGRSWRALKGSDVIICIMKRSYLTQCGRCIGEGQK